MRLTALTALTAIGLLAAIGACSSDPASSPTDTRTTFDAADTVSATDTSVGDDVVDTLESDGEPLDAEGGDAAEPDASDVFEPGPAWDPDRLLPDTDAGRKFSWMLQVLHEKQGAITSADVEKYFSPKFAAQNPGTPVTTRIANFYNAFGEVVVHGIAVVEGERYLCAHITRGSGQHDYFMFLLDADDAEGRIERMGWWSGDNLAPDHGPVAADEVGAYFTIGVETPAHGADVDVVDPTTGAPLGAPYQARIGTQGRGYARLTLPAGHEGYAPLRISDDAGEAYFMSNIVVGGAELLEPKIPADFAVGGALFGVDVDVTSVNLIAEVRYFAPLEELISEAYYLGKPATDALSFVGCATITVDAPEARVVYRGDGLWDDDAVDTHPNLPAALVLDLPPDAPHAVTATAAGGETISLTVPPLPAGATGRVILSLPWIDLDTPMTPDDCVQSFASEQR